ncbi:MAG TPA: MBL fold metallo-hydrolase [Thermoanaerobaculia bacterium]|nr:MBL fold metallo-hydrolase [Thermoanaerobaculia bacterium]
MRRLYLLALTALLALPAAAQRDFSKVEVKATKVAGTVYMLTGAGGNIGACIGDDGIVIVDDQFAPLAPKIKEALKAITDKPLRFVINTHYHPDHTGGNEVLGREAPIIAQENVRKRLKTGTKVGTRDIPASPNEALPVVTFENNVTVHVNGEDIRAVYFPNGHTDGDAVIYFPQSNVVHMGDDFFNGLFPIIDIDNGGGVKGLIRNIEKAVTTFPDDAKVIPGHGPLSDKAGLRAFAEMLRGTSTAVEKGIKAGKTLQQSKDEKVLEPWAGTWGKGGVPADAYIETLFRDLSRK